MIAPAILILLLVGLFPLIYSLVVSFQNITMTDVDTSFAGLLNYKQLFKDLRLWQALGHTALITVIALPLELIFGFLLAQLFLEKMPGPPGFRGVAGFTDRAFTDCRRRYLAPDV